MTTQISKKDLFKIGFVLFVGLLSPINTFYQINFLPLQLLRSASPSALLFSKKNNFQTYFRNSKFVFSNGSKSVTRVFKRKYYRNLKGPHRIKLLYFTSLKKQKLLADPKNKQFYQSVFCDYDYYTDSFELPFKPENIKILIDERVLHDITCNT